MNTASRGERLVRCLFSTSSSLSQLRFVPDSGVMGGGGGGLGQTRSSYLNFCKIPVRSGVQVKVKELLNLGTPAYH